MSKVYIKSAAMISLQKPLCDEWMDNPRRPQEAYLRADDPVFSEFIPPMQARRMGLLLRRAVVTSEVAVRDSGIAVPEAVVSGTGLGCMENTERVLSVLRCGEEGVGPTDFMQSTHNTIASTVAIRLGLHGYNCTYSQGDVSFECALLDAFVHISAGRFSSALVLGNDEMTGPTFEKLTKAGYFKGLGPGSEVSVAMVLSSCPDGALCEVADVRVAHGDAAPIPCQARVYGDDEYKPVFGEGPSASAAGVYAGAKLVASGSFGPVLVHNVGGPDKGFVLLKMI